MSVLRDKLTGRVVPVTSQGKPPPPPPNVHDAPRPASVVAALQRRAVAAERRVTELEIAIAFAKEALAIDCSACRRVAARLDREASGV